MAHNHPLLVWDLETRYMMCNYTTALIFVYSSIPVHCSSVFMFIGFSVTWKIVAFGYRY